MCCTLGRLVILALQFFIVYLQGLNCCNLSFVWRVWAAVVLNCVRRVSDYSHKGHNCDGKVFRTRLMQF